MTAAPKVFISYSWSSKIVVNKVLELAIRLRENGVEVIIDKWYLKEGQDKYDFMEKMVKDVTIDKVLVMCDKSYAQKADDRTGGVGDETVIISSKVYGEISQEKFIPVVLEKDDSGKPYKPIYLSARIHFDLSNEDTFEAEYERILRNLHQMPEHKMPPVGKVPEWLKNDTTNLGPLNRLLKTISGLNNADERKLKVYCRQLFDTFRSLLRDFITQTPISDVDAVIVAIEKFLPLRNAYVDIFHTLIEAGTTEMQLSANDFICDCQSVLLDSAPNPFTSEMKETIDFIMWEMVLCIVAILYHYQQYDDIYGFATGTFMLRSSSYKGSPTEATRITKLRPYLQIIDKIYAKMINEENKYSKAAEIIIQREYTPIITRDSLAFADLLLYQIIASEKVTTDLYYWFPKTYVYTKDDLPDFRKLISQRRCVQFMPILGAKTEDEFKAALERAAVKEPVMRYSNNYFDQAKRITDVVPLDKIASMP